MCRVFSDLLNLSYDFGDRISTSEIKSSFPHIPDDIIEQFLSAHGRNSDFQFQYGNLDLAKITWCEKEVRGRELIQSSVYRRFLRWTHDVSERSKTFNEKSWQCIDIREDVVNYWATHFTWKSLPIFIHGSLVGENSEYRLVEGHTRLGTLMGLIQNRVIDDEKTHKIWLGM